jgi:crotonobetainyl-CoA:carnitine CoA-transferase CaiB-like acyl-CoA transferase
VRPLSELRVLDLSRLIPGPFATLILADLGAHVDKVEDTGAGDYLRHFPPLVAGEGAAYHVLNRGKRSMVLDLKRPEGQRAFLDLVGSYDVLFEQFRPGVLERLGLGHSTLLERNPRLIVCALTGYGQTGPLAERAGHDLNYLARSGLLGFQGPSGQPPAVPGFQLADVSGGMWSVIAILAALTERAHSGQGRVLDIAMADGVLGFASAALGAALAGAPQSRGDDLLNGGIAPYGTYLSSDGYPMTIAALEPKFWTAFCDGVGIEPDMAALIPGAHQDTLRDRIAAVFRSKSRAQWVIFSQEHDCCVEPVVLPAELTNDAHLSARDLFFELPTTRGAVPQFRTPVTPRDGTFVPPPRAGEHTRDVLRDAGFSDARIDELIQSRVALQS